MEPIETPDAGGNPPTWQPQTTVPDFFASRAVVMPPPAPTYGDPAPTYGAPAPGYGQVPCGAAPSPAQSNRRFVMPSAMTAAVVVIVAVLAVTFGLGKGASVLSNTQMLALVHNASTGLTRSPATTFTMTVTTSGLGPQQTLDISGVASNDSRNGSFTMSGPGLNESFRAVNGVVYIQLPGAPSINNGKPWVGVRSTTPTAQQQQLESSGPEGMLKVLANVGGTVHDDGNQTIDGVQTTEYSVDVDVTKLLAAESPQLASSPSVQSLGLNNLPMTIWIDKQGLPRKLTMDLSVNGVTVDELATMTPSNVVPKVSAPPASQVQMYNSLSDFEASINQLYSTAGQPSY